MNLFPRIDTLDIFDLPGKLIYGSKVNVNLLNEDLSILQSPKRDDIPIKRSNADQVRNVYVQQLIELQHNGLCIANGRLNEFNSPPKTTYKDKSTIDYFISTAYDFDSLGSLEVLGLNSVFSDSHCPLSLKIDVSFMENTRVRTNRKVDNT